MALIHRAGSGGGMKAKQWSVGLLCLLMAALPGAFAVPGLVRSTGLVGTPGTFTVLVCETVGTGRGSHTVCHGSFRPDGGGRTDDRATIDTEYDRGERVAVTRSGGAYYSVTPAAFFGWLTVDCIAGFLLLCAALLFGVPWKGVLRRPAIGMGVVLGAGAVLGIVFEAAS
ncbi:hypothetical protein IPZ58_24590 [Streptomyces roseoverticillatus]|uniref:hypothetical protein n=1 Tax=Streptomyces roseoverticillatus TaxID=66429 RepID=UPI001F3787AC|nr:hypothetical protein [Streptomyces roseoverticillatus]MCF3104745.1 hypothetical protein [Streptomyces roseoverticillatus]